jgi:hypothetical protein
MNHMTTTIDAAAQRRTLALEDAISDAHVGALLAMLLIRQFA